MQADWSYSERWINSENNKRKPTRYVQKIWVDTGRSES